MPPHKQPPVRGNFIVPFLLHAGAYEFSRHCFQSIAKSDEARVRAYACGAAHQVAVARDQTAAALLDITEGAEAVVLEIKEPFGVVEWLRPPDRRDGLDTRKH